MTSIVSKLSTEVANALNTSTDILTLVAVRPNLILNPNDFGASGGLNWTSTGVAVSLAASGILDSTGTDNSAELIHDIDAAAVGNVSQAFTPATTGTYIFQAEFLADTSSRVMLEIIQGSNYHRSFFDLAGAGTATLFQKNPGLAAATRGISLITASWYLCWETFGLTGGVATTVRISPAPCVSPAVTLDVSLSTQLYAARSMVSLGTTAATYASPNSWVDPPHVFATDCGIIGARNYGRLPFMEYWVKSQDFHQDNRDGGTVTSTVVVRVHIGGGSLTPKNETLANFTAAIMKAIRNMTDSVGAYPNYAYDGDTELGDIENGPWGWYRDVTFRIGHTFGNDDMGYG